MEKIVKIGVVKCGNIGTSPLFELLLDELADRRDVAVRVMTTGSKMNVEDVEDVLTNILQCSLDMLVFISPNPSIKGPARAMEILSNKELPTVFISDGPGKRVKDEFEKRGFGYIIVEGDPLIGARKEFLDPVEMAIFNSNIIKVLAITGVFRILHQEIDRVIFLIKKGLHITLPKLIIDTDTIRDCSDFRNPYAKAKAMAAYELTKKIAEINVNACFVEKHMEKYVPLVACSHEIAQVAAKLAEEAREIEKYSDTLVRQPHSKSGKLKIKTKLMLPPTLDEELYKKWAQQGE